MFLAILASALASVSGPASSQQHARERAELQRTVELPGVPTVLEGHVLTPEGLPVADALVLSSAGGRTRTAADGSFRLEVELASGTRNVQVSALHGAGSASVLASVALAGIRPGAVNPAGILTLQGGSCEPKWLPTFGQKPGMDSTVQALAVFDEGDGPALFAAGLFLEAGSVPAFHVARWNGWNWTAMGEGLGSAFQSGSVSALTVSDVGGSPALYAGGDFGSLGANNVARWTGTEWTRLGTGTNQPVSALATFDDGGGPALFAGGSFGTAGGAGASSIARWNGTGWSALAGGTDSDVLALAVFDDGSGPALYAGGIFMSADGLIVNRIARWDGSSWSALGSGMNGPVSSLAVFDDGGGPALYAGGNFTSAGGAAANGIARWDGASWSALASGVSGGSTVNALAVFDDGSGPALFAGGTFTTAGGVSAPRLARWDGASWSAYGNVAEGFVAALAVHDDGSGAGPALVAGGSFLTVDGVTVERIAQRSGGSWSALGRGLDASVNSLITFDDGGGAALYAGGGFASAGGVAAERIARWDGTGWSALGSGMDGSTFPVVEALEVFDDGGGPALYAGGTFTIAGGVAAERIARWDGTTWSVLGSGITGGTSPGVEALAVFDDGSGPVLYAGGRFTQAGGVPASCVARWDGASWLPLGSGVSGGSPTLVHALEVFDDGSGPALYVGGTFTNAGGASASHIARWDGSSWSAVPGSSLWAVLALEVFDDGNGPALYAAGPQALSGVSRWDGTSWSFLGGGLDWNWSAWVQSMTAFDDGSGPALYVGGSFDTTSLRRIARWNGASWAPVGRGMSSLSSVEAFAAFDDPDDADGPALIAGGSFGAAVDSGDSFLARWQGCGAGQTGARFGAAVSSVDVNGDDFSDLIVGEPFYDGPLADEGRVLVYLGSADGLDPVPAWTRRGHQAGARFGAALAGVGDVNGDGYGDVAVGAPGFDVAGPDLSPGPGSAQPIDPFRNSGLIAVFLGSSGGLASPPALFRPGIQDAERLGAAVSPAGDVNGDGFDDVLVGAPGTDGVGAAFVFHGSAAGIEQIPGWLVPAGQASTRFATAVAGGGDVNGDGFDDVVVGAPDAGQGERGRAYAFYGSAAGLSTEISWTTPVNLAPGDGPTTNGISDWGAAVAVVGDVNGGGRADVAIGNPTYDGNTINCCPVPYDIGAVCLFAGSPTGLSPGATETSKGLDAQARLGAAVAGLGDINADGRAETGVGSGHAYDGGVLFLGTQNFWAGQASLFGRGPLSTAGDVDGDGFDDFVSGEPSWGLVHLYRGSADGPVYSGTLSAP